MNRSKRIRANIYPKLQEHTDFIHYIPNMFYPTIFLILFMIATIYLAFYAPK